MARASAAGENAALAGIIGTGSTNTATHTALHVADPSTTGASENANAGSYSRLATSWNAPSGGSVSNSAGLTFTTAGTIAVLAVGEWNSITYAAGAYSIGAMLGASVTSASITIAAGALAYSAS